ncbi:MAG: transporter [Segetibacter sp.]|nr:transporter [Segetibacter sp.]
MKLFLMPSILQLYKSAYSGLSKQTWFLSLVILINRSGTMVVPFMTMYATQKLHYSITDAGIIMALFGAGSIVGAFIGGKLTDAIGFYKVQVFALFSGGIMFIVLGYLQSHVMLCCGTFVLSLVNESFRPANSTAIAYYSKADNRTRSYSLNRLAINLGWAFGGALGGFLASYNYHLLFWVDGLTNICAAIILLLVLPVPANLQSIINSNKEKAINGSSAYKDKQYLFFIFLTILFAFCFFQMFTILPVFLKEQLKINERRIGILMAINGLIIAIIEMVVVFKLEAKPQPLKFIKFGVWLVGISYVVYNLFNGQFLLSFFSIVIITFGEMLSMPFMNSYWISRSADHNRGQYAALYTMAWGTAQIASPSIGGYIADHYSFNVLWWIVFAITVVAGLGYNRLASISLR